MDKKNKEIASLFRIISDISLEAKQALTDEYENKKGLSELNNAVKRLNLLWEARTVGNVIQFPNCNPRLQTSKRKLSERWAKKT